MNTSEKVIDIFLIKLNDYVSALINSGHSFNNGDKVDDVSDYDITSHLSIFSNGIIYFKDKNVAESGYIFKMIDDYEKSKKIAPLLQEAIFSLDVSASKLGKKIGEEDADGTNMRIYDGSFC